jgi:hypothetical protein
LGAVRPALAFFGASFSTCYDIQLAEQPRNWKHRPIRSNMKSRVNGTAHRPTNLNHPWTNGQIERMNRTIKDATDKWFH